MDTTGTSTLSEEALRRLLGPVVPERVARLVNPSVLARRAVLIRERLSDETATRVRRQRCAEIVANKLLETINDH